MKKRKMEVKKSIKTIFDHKLIFSSMKSNFNSLISTLEELSTIRNKGPLLQKDLDREIF